MSSSIFGKFFKFRGRRQTSNESSFSDKSAGNDAVQLEISSPTSVSHNFHVAFDAETGTFTGLPTAWTAWLEGSKIRYCYAGMSFEGTFSPEFAGKKVKCSMYQIKRQPSMFKYDMRTRSKVVTLEK